MVDQVMADAPSGGALAGMKTADLMRSYYGKLFPHAVFSKWLHYGNDSKLPQVDGGFFKRREFCFTMDGDVFIRYLAFKDGAALQQAIVERCPSKIDIGPVYNIDPQRRQAYKDSATGFVPVERELVFDIDMTDYDDVRTCGKEGHICCKCWPYMAAAIKVVDAGLREDFGFQHIFWVFSGRRGVHCWVCDQRARTLSDEQRSSIATYFAIYKGHEKGAAKLALTNHLHPAVARARSVLEQMWLKYILPDQQLLTNPDKAADILAYLPAGLGEVLLQKWHEQGVGGDGEDVGPEVSLDRWQELVELVEARAPTEAAATINKILFAFTYPRLDMEVSKKMNHLLKAPFCVHPKTGKVCVPIRVADAESFNPEQVITVQQLLEELSSTVNTQQEPWRSTRMAEAVDTFEEEFLNALTMENKSTLTHKAREAANQPTMAW